MQRVAVVVFDFDGTLAETRRAVSETVNAALRAHGLPRVSPPFVHRLMGLPLDVLLARLIPPTLKPYDVAPLVAWYREAFDRLGGPWVEPMPGVHEAVHGLRARGVRLAIATSREGSSVARLLPGLGLEGVFEVCVSCEQVSQGKPHPETLERALSALGLDPAQAVMVGDTVWDVEMALAAGVRAWGVEGGCHAGDKLAEAGAQRVLARIDWLLDLLDAG